MKIRVFISMALLATLAVPLTAQAQGTLRGAEEGAAAGGNAAGPLGAIVGGAVGAATGTVGGILGVDDRPRFREYVVRERHPSYTYQGDLRTGVVLPEAGVESQARDGKSSLSRLFAGDDCESAVPDVFLLQCGTAIGWIQRYVQ